MANSRQFFDPFFLLDKLAQEQSSTAPPASDAIAGNELSKSEAFSAQIYSKAVSGYVPASVSNGLETPLSFTDEGKGTHLSTGYATTSFRFGDIVDLWPSDDLDTAGPGKTPEGLPRCPYVPTADGELPIAGQGTIAVKAVIHDKLEIEVHTDEASETERTTLGLRITKDDVVYYSRKNGMEVPLVIEQRMAIESGYLDVGVETIYWLSIDKENGMVRYGKYWTYKDLTVLEATYKTSNLKGELVWRDEKDKWLTRLRYVDIIQEGVGIKNPRLSIQPVPVVVDESPFVSASDSVTLAQLESGEVTVPANLPEACQRLYGNVAGKNIILNDDDFPNFTDAIELSCRREDGWCYQRLKRKAGKGNPDATYLRITLGYNHGDSPGVPYVLEIWPAKHFSSVHDHGDAAAIIKVLHGTINAAYYDTLQKRTPAIIGTACFREGQITWIGPRNFQVHKLHNTSDSVCCTIQCYRYEKEDNKHYEAFRYQDGSGVVQPFTPNSDMGYLAFRKKMKEEWRVFGPKSSQAKN